MAPPKKVLHCPQVKMEKLECAAKIVLPPVEGSSWEADMNRPVVVYKDGLYHMWYTGQNEGKSWIGYAISKDGYNFERQKQRTGLVSGTALGESCGHVSSSVIWDKHENIFKMWYSGGEQYEPDAIGYATSKDGLHWTKWDKIRYLKPILHKVGNSIRLPHVR